MSDDKVDIVYKVVRRSFVGLTSCAAPNELRTFYSKDEWTEADPWPLSKGYGLCVFETFEDARAFQKSFYIGGGEIWKAEAEEQLVPLPVFRSFQHLRTWSLEGVGPERSLEELWASSLLIGQDWPDGTHMYKRVRLLQRIF